MFWGVDEREREQTGLRSNQSDTSCMWRQSEGVRAGVHYVQTVRGGMCGDTLRADSQRGYVRGYTTCRQSEGVRAGLQSTAIYITRYRGCSGARGDEVSNCRSLLLSTLRARRVEPARV